MKVRFSQIVNVNYIGRQVNPIPMNHLLRLASKEQLPVANNNDKILLLIVDMQQDFIGWGALAVPGARRDVLNLCVFIYKNMQYIDEMLSSLDIHSTFQIFHPCWWVDSRGSNPLPYTKITLQDINEGRWEPVMQPKVSRDYVTFLHDEEKEDLTIWPYHCLQGTNGAALENQLANMMYFYSVVKKRNLEFLEKGQYLTSDMYGIFSPVYDIYDSKNIELLNRLKSYDKIIIAGEAKSHCVLDSIRQIVDYYKDDLETTEKLYVLEDCMSIIPGYEKSTKEAYEEFKNVYKVNIVKSTDLKL